MEIMIYQTVSSYHLQPGRQPFVNPFYVQGEKEKEDSRLWWLVILYVQINPTKFTGIKPQIMFKSNQNLGENSFPDISYFN